MSIIPSNQTCLFVFHHIKTDVNLGDKFTERNNLSPHKEQSLTPTPTPPAIETSHFFFWNYFSLHRPFSPRSSIFSLFTDFSHNSLMGNKQLLFYSGFLCWFWHIFISYCTWFLILNSHNCSIGLRLSHVLFRIKMNNKRLKLLSISFWRLECFRHVSYY